MVESATTLTTGPASLIFHWTRAVGTSAMMATPCSVSEVGPLLYVAIATRAFRRYSTYTAATLAGIFTNCVFGAIICFVYLAVWNQNPDAGGYDSVDAVTYAWLGQAMIMTVMLWGGGSPEDLAERIRSGDVAIDLYRPVNLLAWYAAADLGRAAYHAALPRGGPDGRRCASLHDPLAP